MAVIERPPDDPELVEQLEHKWRDAPGIPGFFTTVDHKRIGVRYIYTSFVFFFIAGLAALVMRDQLASPNNNILAPETYNDVVHDARHDDDLPVQHAGARGLRQLPDPVADREPRHGVPAAERLQLLGLPVRGRCCCIRACSSVIRPTAVGSRTCRSPARRTRPGINIDFWGLSIIFVGISTTVGAVNFIVTIFKFRAPGMTFNRMPIFVWSMLVFSFMVIFAVPAVTIAAALLELDRLFGTAFYTPARGRERAALPTPVLVLGPSRRCTSSSSPRPAWCR